MQFKKNRTSDMPEIDLVPMMDVLMSILTFFIIISMTLTGQQVADVKLPKADAGVSRDLPPQSMVVGLTEQKEIRVDNVVVDQDTLAQKMVGYLTDNPEGIILLKADKALAYEDVLTVLAVMRDVGGDQVSLAIE